MSEENTTENQAPIAPDQSFPDLEEGELSEEDLEAAAGGQFKHGGERHNQTANLTSPNIKQSRSTEGGSLSFGDP
ncbi:hypothetical protein H6G52_03800 [Limnothrix sp. FACHB-881]|uniref:hypothetical protein n=1 Tax=Limnothrix sp. FACHB-881 TaxID=2692819 RepID=UPI001689B1FC|nr:hypothetical protein [Limnothrix sp. FACHB-881]MBD2634475.1 hypothetical protein [Limnothrix sp. FACHB-881]